eukprot:TRINITY_DN8071_c1_g3_i2.p1 TRINITY_DN8071_c1_g3~~TRINITY_DN8071_c1_g3_i2.p1  ORF type:complete len:131 (-),score=12.18 TRINITY_DN8071_c1_g3_i2:232-624(-)
MFFARGNQFSRQKLPPLFYGRSKFSFVMTTLDKVTLHYLWHAVPRDKLLGDVHELDQMKKAEMRGLHCRRNKAFKNTILSARTKFSKKSREATEQTTNRKDKDAMKKGISGTTLDWDNNLKDAAEDVMEV